MYFTSLPDHKTPGFNEALHFSKFKKHNIIFNASSGKSNCERHVGCLSLKTVLRGEEWYNTGHHPIAIRPGQFLMLNNDQEYSSRIDGPEKTKVLSIFFREEFAHKVFRDILYSDEILLDTVSDIGGKAPEFFQTLTDIDFALQQKLQNLITALDEFGYDVHMVEEHLLFLLYDLINKHNTELRRTSKVKAVKQSTRIEIYKRLCIAKDFMNSTFMDKQGLSMITNTACLSTPQLTRQFKAVFKTTPHQYLTRIRLGHAERLLKHSGMPVHEITLACGFENTSAFCRLFKKEYGVSPQNFRTINQD